MGERAHAGPHRRGPDEGRHLGTTADRLVRTADVPCLIVHGRLALPLRCVIIPSDLSDAADGALDLGLTWSAALRLPSASSERTIVEVLYVRPPGPGGKAEGDEANSGRSRTVENAVEESVERTGVGELLKLEPREVEGSNAAAEVLQHARDTNANLLVLGTHGASAQVREQIGSVSSEVAQEADCPVLLVPPALWRARRLGMPTLGTEPLRFLAALQGFTRDEMYEVRRILDGLEDWFGLEDSNAEYVEKASTLLNVVAVLIGATIGMLIGARMPKRMQESLTDGLGLFTIVLGLAADGVANAWIARRRCLGDLGAVFLEHLQERRCEQPIDDGRFPLNEQRIAE